MHEGAIEGYTCILQWSNELLLQITVYNFTLIIRKFREYKFDDQIPYNFINMYFYKLNLFGGDFHIHKKKVGSV